MSVTWTHNSKLLDKSRHSGLSHQVDPNLNLSSNLSMSDILTSFSSNVKIAVASEKDAGNYTCQPDLITPANITLHVIDNTGEHRLPMLNSQGLMLQHEGWQATRTLVLLVILVSSMIC